VSFENAPLAVEDSDRATHPNINAEDQAKCGALQKVVEAAIDADELAAKPLIVSRAVA
jgi:hypothetical protein